MSRVLSAFDNMFRVLFDDTPLETPSPYITRAAYLSFVLKHPAETSPVPSTDIFQIVTPREEDNMFKLAHE